MKRILIGDNREELVATLESLLKNWGYRAIATAESETFLEMHKELKPDLLIMGASFWEETSSSNQIKKISTPIIYIQETGKKTGETPEGETISYPVDIFKLFSSVQSRLEKIPRRNIRMTVKMPGLYYKEAGVCIAEVLSLSPEGLFLKTGSKIDKVDNIRLILPLIGMQTELEIEGRIIYRIEPTPTNNYMQGMGIEFTDVNAEIMQTLEQYVEGLLFNELNERQFSRNVLNTDHLRKHTDEPVLQLTPVS